MHAPKHARMRARTRTHARTLARMHARAHAHKHACTYARQRDELDGTGHCNGLRRALHRRKPSLPAHAHGMHGTPTPTQRGATRTARRKRIHNARAVTPAHAQDDKAVDGAMDGATGSRPV